MAKGLTKRQHAVLNFIIDCIRERGCPPTIAEICQEFGISSTNGANDHLCALEKKGYIERSSKARSIRLTEKNITAFPPVNAGVLPLLGRVAAGQPLLAQENIEGYVPVSASLAEEKAYCLRVNGESMVEDGILDGDIIIVSQDRPARPGDIVVALVEDEATVKHYHPDGSYVELRPANAAMRPMRFPAAQVMLQGVVVALQRNLLN
jgi:repressor LexA